MRNFIQFTSANSSETDKYVDLSKLKGNNEAEPKQVMPSFANIRLSETETYCVLFTALSEEIIFHYLPDLKQYIRCNGPDCYMCKAGIKKEPRFSMPVYCPTSETIGLLQIPLSKTPHSLLPQLTPYLSMGTLQLLCITREGAKYKIIDYPLSINMTKAEEVIQAFLSDPNIDLSSGYHSYTNEDLLYIGDIKMTLEIKGIIPNSGC